jgi:hypothetical protein
MEDINVYIEKIGTMVIDFAPQIGVGCCGPLGWNENSKQTGCHCRKGT